MSCFFFSGGKINLLWEASLEFINDDYDDDLQVACNLKLLLHTNSHQSEEKNYENHSQTTATPIKGGRMKFDDSRRPHEKMLIF